jgi:hypothetical protein
MSRFTRREMFHVAAMVGVLALGVRCAGSEAEEARPSHLLRLDSALLVPERGGLGLCVELAPSLKERSAEVLARLQADVTSLQARHPLWNKADFGRAPVRLQLGCPGAAMPSSRLASKGATLGPGFTRTPSPFRTFVYVLDEEQAREVLGDERALRARAELAQVDDHVLAEVSTALVVRASDLGTAFFQETWLPTGLGLQPLSEATEPPATDFMPKFTAGSGALP